MFEQLPITYDEVRAKLHSLITDISLEMLDADKEKMLRLHNLGVEIEEESRKLSTYGRLTSPLMEILVSINDTIDDIFHRLVMEEIMDRATNANRRAA